MKSTWPVDPRLRKLPREISITTSTSGTKGDASRKGRRSFASFTAQTYLETNNCSNCFHACFGGGILAIGMLLWVDRFERSHTFEPKDASQLEITASLARRAR
jgi:hypothetical protein